MSSSFFNDAFIHIPRYFTWFKNFVCSIWPFSQISDDLYYLDLWQCAIDFVAVLFKELALITIIEM